MNSKVYLNSSQTCYTPGQVIQFICQYDPEFCYEVELTNGHIISRMSGDNHGEEHFNVTFTNVTTNNTSYSFICRCLPEETGNISNEVIIKACGKLILIVVYITCLLYTSPSPRDRQKSRMPSSA